ncbi:MAG: capsule biosynthesis protein [Paracoccaceae bacterium]
MTTKPRGKKFRIRRGGSLAEPLSGEQSLAKGAAASPDSTVADDSNLFTSPEDGFGDETYPTAAKENLPSEKEIAKTVEAIKAEGLTARQLRMARRLSLKHQLEPASDLDAVRLLRDKGIDPFRRSTKLELVIPDGDDAKNLPETVNKENLPSTQVLNEDTRAREILLIQHDIAKRRKRQTILLFARLSFFVLLPTFLVGLYYYTLATPLYATKSEFLIQQADSQSGGSLGGLFSGTGFATSQDSITVQSYLQSREAMLRLDEDFGYKLHFTGDNIDPLLRLEVGGTNEAAYRLYKKMVKIGYDATEGLVKMEVIAADPQASEQYSRALISYAEEQVDNLTQRLRGDQMQGSRDSFEDAENKMLGAQNRVLELQERLGVIDAASETAALMGQITNFEMQLQQKGLQLQQLLDNSQPNQARVDGVTGDIDRLRALVGELRAQLTQGGSETASLARISGEMRIAEIELQTRQAMMQQALQQLETARIAANRQVRYLSLGVSPIAPDEATYPRKFENTVVAFFIFCGLYLMASLTASILREQVSA